MDAWRVRESVDFLSLASGRRDGDLGAISGVFGDPEKAGAKLNVSNLAVIQRAATASDRSDLKPPWLTASGQTAIFRGRGRGDSIEIGGTTLCKVDCPCTGARDAVP